MKIILLSDVYNHGVAGEVVDVAPGFARNYLIPKGLATKATQVQLKRYAKMRDQSEARRDEYEGMLNELGRKIDGTMLVFYRRAANSGKLFGSVTTEDIADALLDATGVDINRRRISQQALRDIGMHRVPVRLGTDISPILSIRVVAEGERVDLERQREAIAEGLLDQLRFDEDGHLVNVDLMQLRRRQEKAEEEAAAQDEVEAARDALDDDYGDVPAASGYDDYEDVPAASDEPVGMAEDEDNA